MADPGTKKKPKRRKWMTALPWALLLVIFLAAAAIWLETKFPFLRPAQTEATPPAEEHAQEVVEILPPDEPAAVAESGPPVLQSPDGFPKEVGGFVLETVKKEDAVKGSVHYHSAAYRTPDGGEVSMRFLVLDPKSSEQFLRNMLRALLANEAVQNVTTPVPDAGSPWKSFHLFSRADAGIFIAHRPSALLLVSAPSPDQARSFGTAIEIKE